MENEERSVLRVLVADDDEASASAVARLLGAQFSLWVVDVVALPMEALGQILDNAYDALLLDRCFGADTSGLEVCRLAREAGSSVPIVMFSGIDSVQARVEALEAGADEFIAKGSLPAEELGLRLLVAARLRERRTPEPEVSAPVVHAGPLKIDLANQTCSVGARLVHLPRIERRLLMRLAQSKGEPVSHEELCQLGGMSPGPGYKNLHNEMLRLRKQLGPDAGRLIVTVRSTGYRLVDGVGGWHSLKK